MFCRHCGAKNNDGSKFCTSCGANLQGDVDSVEKVVINIGNQVDKEFDSAVDDVKDTILNDNNTNDNNANNNITSSNTINTSNNYV